MLKRFIAIIAGVTAAALLSALASTESETTRPADSLTVRNQNLPNSDTSTNPIPQSRFKEIDISTVFTKSETLKHQDFLVQKRHKVLRRPETMSKPIHERVSYGVLKRGRRTVMTFDDGYYFGAAGNGTNFGLVSLLGAGSKQLLVSQDVNRAGAQWIVDLSSSPKLILSTSRWGVGREGHDIGIVDFDNDGVFEIRALVTDFYSLHDKMSMSEIPLPGIIFKYDAKQRTYIPANHSLFAYKLPKISGDEDTSHLRDASPSEVISVLLEYVYAGEEEDGWRLYESRYRGSDKQEMRKRIESILRRQPVYKFIYQNHRYPKQTAEISLPPKMKVALDRRFPGWKYLEVEEEITTFLRQEISRFVRPDLISGDFNGDGRADYAVLIEQIRSVGKRREAEVRRSYLVIFLKQRTGFQVHVLDPAGAYLTRIKRGRWDYDYETQSYFTYQNDAIFAGIFGKAGTSYIYRKGRFRAVHTSD